MDSLRPRALLAGFRKIHVHDAELTTVYLTVEVWNLHHIQVQRIRRVRVLVIRR